MRTEIKKACDLWSECVDSCWDWQKLPALASVRLCKSPHRLCFPKPVGFKPQGKKGHPFTHFFFCSAVALSCRVVWPWKTKYRPLFQPEGVQFALLGQLITLNKSKSKRT